MLFLMFLGTTTSSINRTGGKVMRRGLAAMLPPHLEEAQRQIRSGEARLLDVREINEWRGAHFKSATLVPLSMLQQGDVPEDVLKEQGSTRFYLHCAGGIRVHPARAILERLGFVDVVPLGESMAELYERQFDELANI